MIYHNPFRITIRDNRTEETKPRNIPMSKLNLDTPPLTGAIRIPKGNYKLRFTEEPEFKLTKKKEDKPQRPMLVFKAEVVEPASKIVDGEEVVLAGTEFTIYAVVFENEDKDGNITEACRQLTAIHRQCKLPLDITRDSDTGLPVDDNGIPISYVGLEIWAKCSSEEFSEKDDSGEVMVNPITGEEQKGWRRQVDQIYDTVARV